MAKERKTKRQKILSDKRHSHPSPTPHAGELYHLGTIEPSSTVFTAKTTSVSTVISAEDYTYFLNDIKKIAIVTGIIILSELGIYWTSVGF